MSEMRVTGVVEMENATNSGILASTTLGEPQRATVDHEVPTAQVRRPAKGADAEETNLARPLLFFAASE